MKQKRGLQDSRLDGIWASRSVIRSLCRDSFAWGPTSHSPLCYQLGAISLLSADRVHFAEPLPLWPRPVTLCKRPSGAFLSPKFCFQLKDSSAFPSQFIGGSQVHMHKYWRDFQGPSPSGGGPKMGRESPHQSKLTSEPAMPVSALSTQFRV